MLKCLLGHAWMYYMDHASRRMVRECTNCRIVQPV